MELWQFKSGCHLQKETPANRLVFLFGYLEILKCSAEMNSACAEVLACGQNSRTAQTRRPNLRGPVLSGIYTLRTRQKKTL